MSYKENLELKERKLILWYLLSMLNNNSEAFMTCKSIGVIVWKDVVGDQKVCTKFIRKFKSS